MVEIILRLPKFSEVLWGVTDKLFLTKSVKHIHKYFHEVFAYAFEFVVFLKIVILVFAFEYLTSAFIPFLILYIRTNSWEETEGRPTAGLLFSRQAAAVRWEAIKETQTLPCLEI